MKTFERKITTVIPALNEEKGIAKVIDDMRKNIVSDIIVVDGRSTDRTIEIAKQRGAIIAEEHRKGYGRAYKTGFKKVSNDTDVVVCLDADGTYPVNKIRELVDTLEREKLDFISGSRITDGNMTMMHKVGNSFLTLFTNALFNVKIRDSQSGMWIFRKSILDKVNAKSDGMSFSEEFKIRAIKAGFRFKEIDVPYGKRIGKVKLRSFNDGFGNLFYLLKMKFKNS